MAALIDARFVGSQGDYSCNDLLEAPCHCRCQWISSGWTCNNCYNTGSTRYYLRRLDTNNFEILTFHREDWVKFRIANDTHQDDLSIWIQMIHVMERHRRQGRARWMLQRVQNHFPGRDLAGLVKEFGVWDVNRKNYTGTTHFDEAISFWKKLCFQIHRQSALVEAFSDGTPVTCYRAEILLPAGTPMAAADDALPDWLSTMQSNNLVGHVG